LEIEYDLIENGNHPEYHQKLKEYEQQRDVRLVRANNRLLLQKQTAKLIKASSIKQAKDTLLVMLLL
jgi:hypothetical protein